MESFTAAAQSARFDVASRGTPGRSRPSHLLEEVFFAVARQVDWDEARRRRYSVSSLTAGYPAPDGRVTGLMPSLRITASTPEN